MVALVICIKTLVGGFVSSHGLQNSRERRQLSLLHEKAPPVYSSGWMGWLCVIACIADLWPMLSNGGKNVCKIPRQLKKLKTKTSKQLEAGTESSCL